jgi:hypothetical protein
MAEDIPHEIDCGAFHRQRLCSFVGEDDGEYACDLTLTLMLALH